MRILVVEDDRISRLYLSQIVSTYGDYDVAEDGEIASEKIKKSFEENKRYDVIFLDIMLPYISGHTLLQLIRAYEADLDIKKENRTIAVMTTSLKDSQNVSEAYGHMVDAYLVKPILKEKIQEIFLKINN